MKNTTLNNAETTYTDQDVLKTTALLYLQEALFNQEYEQCAQLVLAAKKAGASAGDIKETITTATSGKKTQKDEGKLGKNRLRIILKEK